MDKTPSGERDDELCISEELNVTDDDDKGSILLIGFRGRTITRGLIDRRGVPLFRRIWLRASHQRSHDGRERVSGSSL